MRPGDNIEKKIERLHFKAGAKMHDRILGDVLKSHNESKKAESAAMQLNAWRIIIKTKITRKKIAVLCCVALVSVTAAMVGPSVYHSVYNTAQSFLSTTVEQRVGELIELADPMSAVSRQMVEELPKLEIASGLEFVSLHADNEWALGVTTDVVHVDEVYDEGRKEGPLVITLVKRDDLWLVTDIDLETEATAQDEVERFLKRHPNAVEIPRR